MLRNRSQAFGPSLLTIALGNEAVISLKTQFLIVQDYLPVRQEKNRQMSIKVGQK